MRLDVMMRRKQRIRRRRTLQLQGKSLFHSTPTILSYPFNQLTSYNSHTTQQPYSDRDSVAVPVPVKVEDLQLQYSISWNEPFIDSAYSSAEGYASPIPDTHDYSNMFANTSSRARTSSNASFIEPWGYPSRSPTSTALSSLGYSSKSPTTASSTMAYTWTPNAYPMQSLPMSSSLDPMTGYGYFGPKTMAQRDAEEEMYIFPEEQFDGLSSVPSAYEQYFDNYWRYFNPFFPVIHRATVDSHSWPPMIRAAMIAIGAQYSSDPGAKRKSRILTDRCLKLLDKVCSALTLYH